MKSKIGDYSMTATRKPVRPPRPKSASIRGALFATTSTSPTKTRHKWIISNRPVARNQSWSFSEHEKVATTASPMADISSTGGNFSQSPSGGIGHISDNDLVFEPFSLLSAILTAIPVGIIIFIIVAGNALVIAAVLRDSRLKKQVQNWLIVSVAAADLFVGLLIMPLTLTYELLDQWVLGDVLCELWLALDVLFVTASILNLCAISLDRYWSLTDPMRYPQKRTPRRMLLMIVVVWLSAFAISFPPLVGWRPENRAASACFLSEDIGYVLYSAFGSFYIPVFVLLFVYARIYCITKRRSRNKPKSKPFFTSGAVGATTTIPLTSATVPTIVEPKATVIGPISRGMGNSDSSGSNEMTEATSATTLKSGANGLSSARPSVTPDFVFTENDYAVLIAKIRSMAMNSRNGSIISDNVESSVISTPDRRQSNRALSIVATIANEAAVQSRSQRQDDPLAQKALDLKKQLLQRQKLVRRRERQATLVLGLVLGAFIGSWMPFFCSYVLSAVGLHTPELLFDLIFWLGYCNSGLNPFIYNFFNPDFRRAFRRILRKSIEKVRRVFCGFNELMSTDRRRSSTASALIGRKTSAFIIPTRHGTRRGAVFSPKHPYLQVQEHHYQQQRQALIVSQFDNLDE